MTDGTQVIPADTSSSYDLILRVADRFVGVQRQTTGSSCSKLWSILAKGKGIAFGKVAEIANTIDFDFETLFRRKNVFSNDKFGQTMIERSGSVNGAAIGFQNSDGVLGYVGMLSAEGNTLVKWSADTEDRCNILDADNFSQYALPKNRANKVLWSGAVFLNASQTVTLSEAVSAQPNGIVLVWSFFKNSAAQNWDFVLQFIPKQYVASFSGYGIAISEMATDGNFLKYIYVKDTQITGNAQNMQNNTIGGMTFVSASYVLRQVVGI